MRNIRSCQARPSGGIGCQIQTKAENAMFFMALSHLDLATDSAAKIWSEKQIRRT